MTTIRRKWLVGGGLCLVFMIVMLARFSFPQTTAGAVNINPPAFDFNDDFYTKNGLRVDLLNQNGPPADPTLNGGSRAGFIPGEQFGKEFGALPRLWGGVMNWTVDNSNTDRTRRNLRLLQTTGGFDKDGNLIYYNINAVVRDSTFFTTDASGKPTPEAKRNRALADQFRAFIFPVQFQKGVFNTTACSATVTTNCVALDPAPGNRRQDNCFDTQTGYFCENLLGLWLLTFVVYTPAAIITPSGQQMLATLASQNGISLDGTPILKKVADIDKLVALGLVQLLNKSADPHPGAPRWVV